eukprot:jgi/Mesvir1/26001/Mv17946-RA.1
MTTVLLNVYDVTNCPNENTNAAILHINRALRDGVGIGGIFHGGVEIFGDEWSFGYCEEGTGVFCCAPRKNSMYTYRETITLGVTAVSTAKVREIIKELSQEWQGNTYDLFGRNCNHFCEAFCQRLGVGPLPAWVNRLANGADAALDFAGSAMDSMRAFGSDLSDGMRSVLSWIKGDRSNRAGSQRNSPMSARSAPAGTTSDDRMGGEAPAVAEVESMEDVERDREDGTASTGGGKKALFSGLRRSQTAVR